MADSVLPPFGLKTYSRRMDQAMLRKHLMQARQAVALGAQHIARQKEIIANLERAGRDAVDATTLLELFVSLQVEHELHRDRLLKELGGGTRY
jgi:hypothetical protein